AGSPAGSRWRRFRLHGAYRDRGGVQDVWGRLMRSTTTLLVVVACVFYVLLALFGGRSSLNGGLGPDGAVYQAMAVNHDLQAGSAVDKLAPAFPLAAAIAYSVTGNVELSFLLVNIIAFGLLVWATCWLLDLHAAPVGVKVTTLITLVLLGIPTRTSAFAPGQPHLFGVAALSLAVAAATWCSCAPTSILQVGAVVA